MNHPCRYEWLDAVRGISAFLVCAGHLRVAAMVDFRQIEDPGWLNTLFYFLTALGHQAVIIFFVLSGFFVGGSLLNSGRNFSFVSYALARIVRLWVVLIPALALTLLLDSVLAVQFPEVLAGELKDLWNTGPTVGSYSADIRTFAGNMLFLQTILVPVFGTNGPLWSLANEFWYYVMFPLTAVALGVAGDQTKLYPRVACGAMAIAIFLWLPAVIADYFWIWLMGVASYLCHRGLRYHWIAFYGSAAVFLLALGASKIPSVQSGMPVGADFLVGIAFDVFCTFLASRPRPRPSRVGEWFSRVSSIASEMSYSLYLTHFPMVMVIGALYYSKQQTRPDVAGYGGFLLALVVLLVVGLSFWYMFERRTLAIKRAAFALFTDQARNSRPERS